MERPPPAEHCPTCGAPSTWPMHPASDPHYDVCRTCGRITAAKPELQQARGRNKRYATAEAARSARQKAKRLKRVKRHVQQPPLETVDFERLARVAAARDQSPGCGPCIESLVDLPSDIGTC